MDPPFIDILIVAEKGRSLPFVRRASILLTRPPIDNGGNFAAERSLPPVA